MLTGQHHLAYKILRRIFRGRDLGKLARHWCRKAAKVRQLFLLYYQTSASPNREFEASRPFDANARYPAIGVRIAALRPSTPERLTAHTAIAATRGESSTARVSPGNTLVSHTSPRLTLATH
jgi:hypothetical protein